MATRCTEETIVIRGEGPALVPVRAIAGVKITAETTATIAEIATVIVTIGVGIGIATAMTEGAAHQSANTVTTAATGREEDAIDSILMMIIKEGEK